MGSSEARCTLEVSPPGELRLERLALSQPRCQAAQSAYWMSQPGGATSRKAAQSAADSSHQHVDGPAVRDDVVHGQQQDVPRFLDSRSNVVRSRDLG